MGRTYQVSVIGMQGEKKTIDVANSEEEFNNMTVEKFKKKLAEKLPQEASGNPSALRLLYTSKQLNDTDNRHAQDKCAVYSSFMCLQRTTNIDFMISL
uniref:Ubiquitin-like domain-containing protein n=1 Tax=Sinocyclocheilus rhinocerous TaxID=307959 RepID=A0A673FNG1_9TELE